MESDFTGRFKGPVPLAEGGGGQVFKAQDPRLERQVAIKVMRGELLKEPKHTERFLREARSTGILEHPNIPPVYEYGETEGGRPYFVLKLIEGQTLACLVEKLQNGAARAHQEFPFARRVQIGLDLVQALEYAHSQGIVHRDVKTDNVMLGTHGEVWLVDWGLASPPSQEAPSEERLTEEYAFVGTIGYAAPEQMGGTYSEQSDQFALGVVLYELFALQPPFPGKNRYEVMTGVMTGDPTPAENHVHPVQGRVPRETSVLIQRMLAKKPEDRFPDMKTVREELEIILGGDIRAICPHTFMKKRLYRFGRLLDNHNRWLAPLLVLWLCYPIVHLIQWLLDRYFWT